MANKSGEWLSIGGASAVGWGCGRIEVRVAGEGAAWEWREIPHSRIVAFCEFMNQHPTIRDMLLRDTGNG
jgi:hypothetical protein